MIRELFIQDLSLWTCLWQSTAFLMLGLLAGYLLRRCPSRAYHVLLFAMASAVAVPLGSAGVKHFGVGLFVRQEVEPVHALLELPASTSFEAADAGSFEVPLSEPVVSQLAEIASTQSGISWCAVLLGAWAMATFILLARLLATFIYGVLLVRHADCRGSERIERAIDQAQAKIGSACGLRVRASEGIRSPVVWCWSRPPILLVPQRSEELDVDWSGVIAHELAHCLRRDHMTGALAELAMALLPWHPLMWLSKKYLVRLGEQACDDWVVASGQPGEDYAEALLHFRPQRQMAFLPGVVHSKKGLAARVRRVLNDACGNPRAGTRWALTVTVVALCAGLAVAFAQARPVGTQAVGELNGDSTEALHEAVRDGNLERVKTLVAAGSDVNARNGRAWTPLHFAAWCGRDHSKDIAEVLVAAGAHLDVKDDWAWTPLHRAVEVRNVPVVELLIQKGAAVNIQDSSGKTPLHFAVRVPTPHSRLRAAEKLIAGGARGAAQDQDGDTPLHLACLNGHEDIAELLITNGADLGQENQEGDRALHMAAVGGHIDIIGLLLDKGAEVDARDRGDCTPLHLAAKHGWPEACQVLINRGADVKAEADDGATPLHMAAAWWGSRETVEQLLDKGADVGAKTKDGDTAASVALGANRLAMADLLIREGCESPPAYAVFVATRKGNLHEVKNLLERGIGINANEKPSSVLLHVAGVAGHRDVVDFLITQGVDVNGKDPRGETALLQAINGGHHDIVQNLLAAGADVQTRDRDGMTPLHRAARNGYKEVAGLLILNGAEVDDRTGDTNSPLFFAAWAGHLDVVRLLAQKGADLSKNVTALHYAIAQGHTDVVEFLLENGADVNGENMYSETPLHYAIWHKRDDAVALLIGKGANPNVQDSAGWSPLHYLASAGRSPELVSLLITEGADVNIKTQEGDTPLSLAAQKGYGEIIDLLKKHGAKE